MSNVETALPEFSSEIAASVALPLDTVLNACREIWLREKGQSNLEAWTGNGERGIESPGFADRFGRADDVTNSQAGETYLRKRTDDDHFRSLRGPGVVRGADEFRIAIVDTNREFWKIFVQSL